jgi:hypothetical protein
LFVLIIDNQDEGISPGGLKRDEKESVQKKEPYGLFYKVARKYAYKAYRPELLCF